MIRTVAAAIAAYVMGCLVGAYYVVRIRTGRDVRETGSGNAGARNVLRTGDATSAALTLAWDVLKGALAVMLARNIAAADLAVGLAVVAVVIGHIWPAQLQFHGGKGVAAVIGAVLATNPLAAITRGSWIILACDVTAIALVALMHHRSLDRPRRAAALPGKELME